MSLHQYDSVNSTILRYDERQSLLTPGQIAAITLTSTFTFYMTIMFLVCIGEYCKYIKGKKDKTERRRRLRHSAAYRRGVNDPQHSATGGAVEIGVEQSDVITSISPNQSDSSCTDRDTSGDHRPSLVVHVSEPPNHSDVVEIHFEHSLDNVNIECVDGCEMTTVSYEQDTVMLPLIPRPCEETFDTDGDIFCESVDSRNVYPLEADV